MLIPRPSHLVLFIGHERDLRLKLSTYKDSLAPYWLLITTRTLRLHLRLGGYAFRLRNAICLLFARSNLCTPTSLICNCIRQEENTRIRIEVTRRLRNSLF